MDIGHNHSIEFLGWSPDRDLNPQYKDVPDIEKFGAAVSHLNKDGQPCEGFITFDLPEVRDVLQPGDNRPLWQVESWEPFTVSPSLLCKICGDHGFIRDGKWVPA